MNFHPTLSAPLPWLTAFAKLLIWKKWSSKHTVRPFILPRTLSFTKEGKRYIATLFVIGIAAINTGNNLLYLVVAMMLSLIVVSGILSESTLRGVEINRTMPGHIFAGRPAAVRWNISNKKRVLPSFSITIDELPLRPLFNKEGDGGSYGFSSESGYTIKLPAHASLAQTRLYTFSKRGLYKLEGFKITTRFPFGFFLKGRRLFVSADLLVYPNPKPIRHATTPFFLKTGEMPEKAKGGGANLHTIRDYTLTDDSRFIHWRQTAKTARLMAKEFEREGRKRVKIIFYNTMTASPNFKDEFEEKVEEAAGIADYFIRAGFEVGFESIPPSPPFVKGGGKVGLPCKSGKEQLYRILRGLAIIEPVAGDKTMSLGVKVVNQ